MTANLKKTIKKDQEKVTKHFMQTLPALITKYESDCENLANIILIPQYFDLNIFTKPQAEENLDSLLVQIQSIIKTVDDSELLTNAFETLAYFCSEGYAIFTRCAII